MLSMMILQDILLICQDLDSTLIASIYVLQAFDYPGWWVSFPLIQPEDVDSVFLEFETVHLPS